MKIIILISHIIYNFHLHTLEFHANYRCSKNRIMRFYRDKISLATCNVVIVLTLWIRSITRNSLVWQMDGQTDRQTDAIMQAYKFIAFFSSFFGKSDTWLPWPMLNRQKNWANWSNVTMINCRVYICLLLQCRVRLSSKRQKQKRPRQ